MKIKIKFKNYVTIFKHWIWAICHYTKMWFEIRRFEKEREELKTMVEKERIDHTKEVMEMFKNKEA